MHGFEESESTVFPRSGCQISFISVCPPHVPFRISLQRDHAEMTAERKHYEGMRQSRLVLCLPASYRRADPKPNLFNAVF